MAKDSWSWADYQRLAGKKAPVAAPEPVVEPEPVPEPEPDPKPKRRVKAERKPKVAPKPQPETQPAPQPALKTRERRIETASAINVKSVDKHVGGRIREARVLAGISQIELGEFIGVTFQQVQKYERGANRIGPGRLAKISEKLGFPIAWFYEGVPQPGSNSAPQIEARAVKIARLLEGVPDDVTDNVLALLKAMTKAS